MKLVYNFDGSTIPIWVMALFWLIYMLAFVYAFNKTLLPWRINRSRVNKLHTDVTYLFIIFFTLYAIFYCVNDDYFQYRDWIYGRDFGFWGKEMFYVYVILFCRFIPFDYPFELFRLIVWGGAILLVFFTFRMYRKKLMPGLVLLMLFVFYSNAFCYARASLGMAVFFLGVSLYLRQKQWAMKALGIVIAMSAVFFHREMLVGIAVLPSLFIPLEKRVNSYLSVFMLLLVTLGISLIGLDFNYFDSIFDNDDISNKLEEFSNQEQGAFRLSTLIKYLNYFYPFYLVTMVFWEKRVPHSVAGFYRIAYSILLISVAFMIILGLRSVYTYRIMYISMIPLTLLTGFCFCKGYLKRNEFLIMMMLSLLSNSSRFINA